MRSIIILGYVFVCYGFLINCATAVRKQEGCISEENSFRLHGYNKIVYKPCDSIQRENVTNDTIEDFQSVGDLETLVRINGKNYKFFYTVKNGDYHFTINETDSLGFYVIKSSKKIYIHLPEMKLEIPVLKNPSEEKVMIGFTFATARFQDNNTCSELKVASIPETKFGNVIIRKPIQYSKEEVVKEKIYYYCSKDLKKEEELLIQMKNLKQQKKY